MSAVTRWFPFGIAALSLGMVLSVGVESIPAGDKKGPDTGGGFDHRLGLFPLSFEEFAYLRRQR